MRAGARNFRVVREDVEETIALEEFWHDHIFERVAFERRALQSGDIAIRHKGLQEAQFSRGRHVFPAIAEACSLAKKYGGAIRQVVVWRRERSS